MKRLQRIDLTEDELRRTRILLISGEIVSTSFDDFNDSELASIIRDKLTENALMEGKFQFRTFCSFNPFVTESMNKVSIKI